MAIVPLEVQHLIGGMARANATWGEARIAAELQLELGISVSPRTVRRYMGRGGRPQAPGSSQRWSTFVRNHADAIIACDFFVTITASFRMLYVFVVLRRGHAPDRALERDGASDSRMDRPVLRKKSVRRK